MKPRTITRALLAGLATALLHLDAAAGLDLREAYELALANDAQYQAAVAAYDAALQARPLARSGYLPQVNLSADYNANRREILSADSFLFQPGVQNFNSTSAALSVSQAVYRREVLVQMRQADASIDQALAEVEAAEQDLIVRVATEYFGVLAAQDNLEFATAEKEAVARQLEQAQKRFEVGLIAITDVKEAKARFDTSSANEIRARNRLENAYESLRVVIGEMHRELASLAEDIPLVRPDPADVDAWVARALEANRSLSAARAAEEVARQSVSLAKSDYYPTLDVVGSYQYSETDGQDPTRGLGDVEQEDGIIGLQLNVPLYLGGARGASVEQAAQRLNQAVQGQIEARRRTIQQTRDAYLGVILGIQQVEAFQSAVESNKAALEATEAGFEVGTRTSVDVLISVQSTAAALRDYAGARYQYILNGFALKQAAGTLAPQDVVFVNNYLE